MKLQRSRFKYSNNHPALQRSEGGKYGEIIKICQPWGIQDQLMFFTLLFGAKNAKINFPPTT